MCRSWTYTCGYSYTHTTHIYINKGVQFSKLWSKRLSLTSLWTIQASLVPERNYSLNTYSQMSTWINKGTMERPGHGGARVFVKHTHLLCKTHTLTLIPILKHSAWLTCPAFLNLDAIAPATAWSTLALSKTMNGARPPSSMETRFTEFAAWCSRTCRGAAGGEYCEHPHQLTGVTVPSSLMSWVPKAWPPAGDLTERWPDQELIAEWAIHRDGA